VRGHDGDRGDGSRAVRPGVASLCLVQFAARGTASGIVNTAAQLNC
jgi:hypothetical protein